MLGWTIAIALMLAGGLIATAIGMHVSSLAGERRLRAVRRLVWTVCGLGLSIVVAAAAFSLWQGHAFGISIVGAAMPLALVMSLALRQLRAPGPGK
jgi:hypothetical protein